MDQETRKQILAWMNTPAIEAREGYHATRLFWLCECSEFYVRPEQDFKCWTCGAMRAKRPLADVHMVLDQMYTRGPEFDKLAQLLLADRPVLELAIRNWMEMYNPFPFQSNALEMATPIVVDTILKRNPEIELRNMTAQSLQLLYRESIRQMCELAV